MASYWSTESNEKRSKALRGRRQSVEHRAHRAASMLVYAKNAFPEEAFAEVYELCLLRIQQRDKMAADFAELAKKYHSVGV